MTALQLPTPAPHPGPSQPQCTRVQKTPIFRQFWNLQGGK